MNDQTLLDVLFHYYQKIKAHPVHGSMYIYIDSGILKTI